MSLNITQNGQKLSVDASGNLLVSIAGGGGTSGTQYVDGVVQATPTGNAILGKSAANVLHTLSLDGSGNLNVNLAAGSITGGNAAASPTGAAVPASADYTGFNSGGVLVGVSAGNPLPVTVGNFPATQTVTQAVGSAIQILDSAGTNKLAVNASGQISISNFPATEDVSDRAARLLGVIYGSQGQQLKQTAANFNAQVELATGATLYDARSIRALTSADVVTAAQSTAANLNATVIFGTPQHVIIDSSATLTVSGTVTSNQGTAAALANKWPVQITDGTNTMPTGDASARTIHVTADNATIAVTQSSGPWTQNLTQLNSVNLGSPSAYGTSPGAVSVLGVNAFITNTVPVTLASTTITGTVAVTQSTSPWVTNMTQVGSANISLGQAVMASSLPVVISSNQSTLTVQDVVDSLVGNAVPTMAVQSGFKDGNGLLRVPSVDGQGNIVISQYGLQEDVRLLLLETRAMRHALMAFVCDGEKFNPADFNPASFQTEIISETVLN